MDLGMDTGYPTASRGGKFAIDLTTAQPLCRDSMPGCSLRSSGNFINWPLGNYRGFVMSSAVQGKGRCNKPTVEIAWRTADVDMSRGR